MPGLDAVLRVIHDPRHFKGKRPLTRPPTRQRIIKTIDLTGDPPQRIPKRPEFIEAIDLTGT
jgi:hypothetical protein